MSLQTWNRFGRIFFGLVLAMAEFLAVQSRAEAAVCKVKLEDIGTIIGKGATKNLAFEDAAEQCFNKKASKVRRASASIDEDTGLAIIDICANVRCDS